jgi:hypothetical protein
MEEPMRLVIAGNPVDGCSFHGPFPHGPDDDVSDIAEWAARVFRGETWWIAELAAPAGYRVDSYSGISAFSDRPAHRCGDPRP